MMRGSSYLGSTPKRALSRPRRFAPLAALFLVFAVLLSGFATLPLLDSLTKSSTETGAKGSTPLISDASALWCADPKEGNLGLGMNSRSDWRNGSAWYPHAETSGRILTAQEAFSNGVKFTNFNGVGASPALPWFYISPPVGLPQTDRDTKVGLNSVIAYTGNTPKGEGTENWYKNMNSSRTPSNCVMGAVGASVANGVLGLTTGITNLMGGIATFAFDPNFICEPNSGASNCIDLVGIIGGSGSTSGDGIIGKLTTSVYFPLLALAALLMGTWIIWNGLAKRQFRETFIGVIWSLVTVILGIALLLNPLMLAKAPMVVGNALTSCIIGAFTGSGGCAGGSSSGTGVSNGSSDAYCEAWSSKSNFVDKAAITMTSMSCQLWKSFVLQPYAQGSFGAPLDQLDTKKSNTIAAKLIAKNPGFNQNTFCVDTKVKGTLQSHYGNTLDLTRSGDAICNLAIYQAYLGIDARVDTSGYIAPASSLDGRWLRLAQVAASDEGMYRSWAPTDLHLAQIGMALIGLISAALAAIVIFVVAAFAMAFYVTSILMIAFAPFFLLAGVHPGKGRKMMIGWIGQVLSNIMKYAASAIFLVITVALYGAVLSNVSNPGAILIFMIILTVALLMYRREIVDMVGAIDLGGEKLSNKFAERTMDRVRNTGKTAMAVGAGMTAGALSNGVSNPFSVESISSTLRAGADSGRRNLKSRPGAIGEVMKASDRISADNRADMAKQANAVSNDAKKATQTRVGSEKRFEGLNSELDSSRVKTEEKLENLQEKNATASSRQFGVQTQLDQLGTAQAAAISSVDNTAFGQYQDLLNQMRNLEMKAVIAEKSGLTEDAESYRAEAVIVGQNLTEVQSTLSEEELSDGQRQYDTALANQFDDDRITPENAASYANHVRREYQGVMGTIGGTAAAAERLKAQQEATERQLQGSIIEAREDLDEATKAESTADRAATVARERIIDLKPGQVVKNTDVRRNAREIAAIQNDRSEDLRSASSTVEERLLDNAAAQSDATDLRDSWRAEAGVQRQGLAESQLAARRLTTVQSDVQQSKEDAANSWRNPTPQTADERAKNAYITHLDAESQVARVGARIEEISAKENSEVGLSELDKSNLFVARREEEAARERMNASERVIRTAGTDLGSMRNELNRATETEYAKRPSAQSMSMDQGVEKFERDLSEAASGVESDIQSRRTALQIAQSNEAAAGRQAQAAQRDAQKLAETAQHLREQAANPKPVTAQGAAKSTSRAERVTERASRAAESGRGIPRPQDVTAPDAALPQPSVVQQPVDEAPLPTPTQNADRVLRQPAPVVAPTARVAAPVEAAAPTVPAAQAPLIGPEAANRAASEATPRVASTPAERVSEAASVAQSAAAPVTPPSAQPDSPIRHQVAPRQPVEQDAKVAPVAPEPAAKPTSAPAPRVTPAEPQRAPEAAPVPQRDTPVAQRVAPVQTAPEPAANAEPQRSVTPPPAVVRPTTPATREAPPAQAASTLPPAVTPQQETPIRQSPTPPTPEPTPAQPRPVPVQAPVANPAPVAAPAPTSAPATPIPATSAPATPAATPAPVAEPKPVAGRKTEPQQEQPSSNAARKSAPLLGRKPKAKPEPESEAESQAPLLRSTRSTRRLPAEQPVQPAVEPSDGDEPNLPAQGETPTNRPSANIRGADDGNPFRGGSSFRR